MNSLVLCTLFVHLKFHPSRSRSPFLRWPQPRWNGIYVHLSIYLSIYLDPIILRQRTLLLSHRFVLHFSPLSSTVRHGNLAPARLLDIRDVLPARSLIVSCMVRCGSAWYFRKIKI